MRWLIALIVLVTLSLPTLAQETETPTPTPPPTETPTPAPWVYMTAVPPTGETEGQPTRFDYVVTAGDVMIAVLLLSLLLSLWGSFVMWWIARR